MNKCSSTFFLVVFRYFNPLGIESVAMHKLWPSACHKAAGASAKAAARQTNLCWKVHRDRLFLHQALCESHVYPITTHDLTWAPKEACGQINNGILAPFYESVSLVPTSFWPDKHFVFIPWIDQWARKVSRMGEKPYCDPWRRLDPLGTGGLHQYQPPAPLPWKNTAMPHMLKEAKTDILQSNLEILWLRW